MWFSIHWTFNFFLLGFQLKWLISLDVSLGQKSIHLFLSVILLLLLLILWNSISWEQGSLRSVVFSSINNIRSDKLGSIVLFFLMLKTLLFHLSSNTPGYFDSNKHIMSGLSRKFQLPLPVTFWHRTKMLLYFLKPGACPNFSCCHSFISFLYDPSSW